MHLVLGVLLVDLLKPKRYGVYHSTGVICH